METPELDNKAEIIAKINELYVQTRFKYLLQSKVDGYKTLTHNKRNKVRMFCDYMLKMHLSGKLTYGIFNGNLFNKFITFDVDYDKNVDLARWVTLKVIDVLVNDFNIMRSDIHTSFSGNKGYHVELFFKSQISAKDAESFYRRVMKYVGKYPGGKVEFRPSFDLGVKIPLGIHQLTGKRCWYVDNQTLEPIESFDYILGIEPMDSDCINVKDFGITDEQAEEFELIKSETDITVGIVDITAAFQKVKRILEAGRLIESNTRHITTVTLASFYNSQGFERVEAIDMILEILHNTPREYFSKGSTPDFWEKETRRLVNIAYDRGYVLGNSDKPVTIYKSEVLAILSCGTYKTKQMLYAMLVTSKRYGRSFYFAQSTGMKMIDTTSKETVRITIKRLIDGGYIDYVQKGVLDTAKSLECGRAHFKPNKYRILTPEPIDGEQSITITSEQSLNDAVFALCTEAEIKAYVKRSEYDSRWRARVSGS